MAETEEIHETEEQWEERTLNILDDTAIDQDFAKAKAAKRRSKKHRVRFMNRPMAIPLVILSLQDEYYRESALRCLSTYLVEKRVEDRDNYYRTGYLLYDSCCTMAILLQEVVQFIRMLSNQNLTIRASKRMANVLTLFQCVAANKEARQKFVKSLIPNFLVPIVLFHTTAEVFDNVRAVALSVIGILCQAREPKIIQWAVESNMVEVCRISIEIGNELSKVIGMHILEAILQDDLGLQYVCGSQCGCVLRNLMNTLEHLVPSPVLIYTTNTLSCSTLSVLKIKVVMLAVDQDFSPRLLFHIIRSYVLLSSNTRGFSMVKDFLPDHITNDCFSDTVEEFPVIGRLLQQLLVTIGKIDDYVVIALPYDLLL